MDTDMLTKMKSEPLIDAGLLVLRLGAAICFLLLFALKQSEGDSVFVQQSGRIWPLVTLLAGAFFATCGFYTRLTAGLVALAWLWATFTGLMAGEDFYSLPARAVQFAVLFGALALTGPGRFSIDSWLQARKGSWAFSRPVSKKGS